MRRSSMVMAVVVLGGLSRAAIAEDLSGGTVIGERELWDEPAGEGGAGLSPVTLRSYRAAQGCPDQDGFVAAIRGELEAAPPTALGELEVDVVIDATASGYELTLTLQRSGQSSVRTLESGECVGLVGSAALVIAMTMEITDSAGQTPLAVEVETPPGPAAPAQEIVFERRPLRLAPSIHARMIGGAGLLPGLALGIESGASIAAGPVRLELAAAYWVEREEESVGVSLLAVPARACLPLAGDWLVSCAGVEAGWMRGRGRGLPQVREGAALHVAATASGRVQLGLGERLRLTGMVEPALHLRRPSFVVLPDTTVFSDGYVSARVLVGAELAFR